MASLGGSVASLSTRKSKWGEPPNGYVPGLGRGASGFTTRSDIGNSMPVAAPAAAAAAAGGEGEDADGGGGKAGAAGGDNSNVAPTTGSRASEQRAAKLAAAQHQKQQQSSAKTPENNEDDEADLIWQAIDDRMNAKRNKRKAATVEDDPQATARAKIGAQFRELKQELAGVSEEDWMQIPDVGDHSLKYKQKMHRQNNNGQDVYTPLSDSLLESRVQQNQHQPPSGTTGAAAEAAPMALQGLGAARGTVLGMSLDKMSDSVSGQTVVDPQGYLTSMASSQVGGTGATAVGDIQKARLLLKSVRDTNPKHGPGWIASARVEEAAGKLLKARKLIQEGCQICGNDQEDVWLEAARLHPTEVAKSILATAVRRIPTSVQLFLKAADLEVNQQAKKAVLRKALEANPTSITLWKAAIDLEEADDAKVLLSVAVERVPHAIELWLALARLESYDNARKVLNQARRALPTERSIWIAAAKLEESQHHADLVTKILARAFSSLMNSNNDSQNNDSVVVTRDQWLQEAEFAEAAGAPLTSAAIIQHAIGMEVLEEDRQRTWAEDAKGTLSRGSVATARAIITHALQHFPTKRSLWMQAVDLERTHGTSDGLDEVLKAASERLPRVELFWLLRAKERWLAGHVDVAREILTKAFAANPDSESVWLAAAKLEWETGETERARVLLQRARERAPTERVYMKSALLERQTQAYPAALELIQQGLEEYPKFPKLYMMAGQIYSKELLPKTKAHLEKARKIYQTGLTECPHNIVLWTLASRLEEEAYTFTAAAESNNTNGGGSSMAAGQTKARSLLELARLKNPKTPELWFEAIRLERRAGNPKLAESLMARALQECSNAGLLLAETILTAARVDKKSKSTVAIKRCPESPLVIAAVAMLFASERKTEKARKWLERAVLLDPDLGDSWARYYSFEMESGTAVQAAAVKERCIKAEPKHGPLWQPIVKDMVNRLKSVGEGLELVAASIQKEKAKTSTTTVS
jgi:pre-mRNA-processing factor 6